MEYNGWTNYATWNVNLWIDNDYTYYSVKRMLLADITDPSMLTAERVEDIATGIFNGPSTPDLDSSEEGFRWEDVNWQEIADVWKEEMELDS